MEHYEKKYKNALEKAKSMIDDLRKGEDILAVSDLEEMFPELKESELKESEDERIRKELLEHCKNQSEPYIKTGNKCPQIQSWIAWLEKQGKQKPAVFSEKKPAAWSDEDEKMLHTIIADFKGFKHDNTSTLESHFTECISWLKSLKDRVQPQQNPTWSDEDEENLQHCCMAISVDSLHTHEDKQDMEV